MQYKLIKELTQIFINIISCNIIIDQFDHILDCTRILKCRKKIKIFGILSYTFYTVIRYAALR